MSDYEDSSAPAIVYPPQGTPMDPKDHPATNMPSATIPYHGGKAELIGTTVKRAAQIILKGGY